MPAGSTSALALAGRLRALDDDALLALLAAREVRDSGIRDFFDLAEALLDRTAVQRALSRLDRPTLAVLAATADGSARTLAEIAARVGGADGVAERLERLRALALLESDSGRFAAYEPVAEQLTAWPSFGLPTRDELIDAPPPAALESVPDTDERFVDRIAVERAYGTTVGVGELVAELQREPARELNRGGLALPDVRRLATAATGGDLERVEPVRDLAVRAGLVRRESGRWLAVDDADAWALRPAAERWGRLASGWLAGIPEDVRGLLGARARARWAEGLEEYLAWYFPAGREWVREHVEIALRDAGQLGILAAGVTSSAGTALLVGGVDAAVAAIATAFPAEVEKVYVQHDLTVVAPGPLAPAADRRLRALADVESRSLASSYRISRDSIMRALGGGETEQSLRGFLSGISLTGIPQPLDYLLSESAARYGSVRVSEDEHGSTIRASEPGLLETIAVDQDLALLGLERVARDHLVSALPVDVVYWSLVDAHYPALAEDRAGRPRTIERPRPRREPAPPDAAERLLERLRLGTADEPEETGQAWIQRQLELAIRSRVLVRVSVTLPDGREVEYRLEPTGLAGGRLRGRDRAADIERTLPLASVTAVSPLT